MTRFESAVGFLDSFINYEKKTTTLYSEKLYNLESFAGFLDELGNPHLATPAFHIAGTKGKGSTSALLASALHTLGFKVGLFTSPHLLSVRERIRINNEPVSEDRFANLIETIRPVAERDGRATNKQFHTFFELMTAAAMLCFKEERVDFAVYETGMGGRLDSTNVVNASVAGLSPIDFDHVQALGDTIEAIATEKAGIIKPGQVVVSAQHHQEAKAVIRHRCAAQQARLIEVGVDVNFRVKAMSLKGSVVELEFQNRRLEVELPLIGLHQAQNLAIAYGMLAAYAERMNWSFDPLKLSRGFRSVNWSGRFQIVDPHYISLFCDRTDLLLILDCAHNPASARALVQTLKELLPDRAITFIIGCSRDKDYGSFIRIIQPIINLLIFTRYSNPRAESPQNLKAVSDPSIPSVVAEDIRQALLMSFDLAPAYGLVVVTGSIFLVSDAMALLKIPVI